MSHPAPTKLRINNHAVSINIRLLRSRFLTCCTMHTLQLSHRASVQVVYGLPTVRLSPRDGKVALKRLQVFDQVSLLRIGQP
jgi:hypothetical protein